MTVNEAFEKVEAAVRAKSGPFTPLERAMSAFVKAINVDVKAAGEKIERLTAERDQALADLEAMASAYRRAE